MPKTPMPPFPPTRSVGIIPERRTLVAWSCHPAEQENMRASGWVEVASIPDFHTIEGEDGPIVLTAKLFVKGPYSTGKVEHSTSELTPQEPALVPEEAGDVLTPES